MIRDIIDELKKTEHGFNHIVEVGDVLVKDKSIDHYMLAVSLLNDESYQGRMPATYILGLLALESKKAFTLLKTKVATDDNWRVQEMLAKAFDNYCKVNGYEVSIPVIED